MELKMMSLYDYLGYAAGGNYYLVWKFSEDTANVIHFHHLHTLNFTDILVWGVNGIEMATGIRDSGTYGIHPWNHDQIKKQMANPDHLPYDPKMGF